MQWRLNGVQSGKEGMQSQEDAVQSREGLGQSGLTGGMSSRAVRQSAWNAGFSTENGVPTSGESGPSALTGVQLRRVVGFFSLPVVASRLSASLSWQTVNLARQAANFARLTLNLARQTVNRARLTELPGARAR